MRPLLRLRQMLRFLLTALALTPLVLPAFAQEGQPSIYRNQKYGFSLTIPAGLERTAPGIQDVGGIWLSGDGQTRLLAVAGPNATAEKLAAYRNFVIQQAYKNAKFDYTPMRRNWFVLSGTIADKIFYERITFACNGRYIYGWQLTYPAVDSAHWDRVVEAIHRSYRPGRGEDGSCGRSARPS